ncbi:hypothetical protein Bca4012_063261 [Brassica carinata]
MAAELVAVYEASTEGIWLRNFVTGLEWVQSGKFTTEHLGKNSMISDPFTKGIVPKVLHEHTARMGISVFEDHSV